jgi:xylulokinase
MSLHIGIDIGTSGVKAVLLEGPAKVLAEAARPIPVSIPHLGWSEQSADLWVEATFDCLDQMAASVPALMGAVAGIGLSGQMLAALLLDAAHKPLRPAMLWNDQRALAECAELRDLCPDIGLRTNGAPDPGITLPKLMWLAKHEPRVMDAGRMLLLPKDYVRLALTGDIASEPTDAGGTQLLDCRSGRWDASLCALVGWNLEYLPPLMASWEAAGSLRPHLASRWGMKSTVMVAAGAGDNMASTLGVGAAKSGDAVLTVGTSGVACIVDLAFHPGPAKAILTSAHAAPETYLSMGVVMSATATLDWVLRLTGTNTAVLAAEAEAFAATGRLQDAPIMLPCLTGIRTPLNRPDAMGRIDGLHPGTTRGMLGYAVMEGVAFQFAGCVAAQRSVGAIPERFAMVGGGSRSPLWTRLLATVLDHPVDLPPGAHVSGPAGAARLAAVATGASIDTLAAQTGVARTIGPDQAIAGVLASRYARFSDLLPAQG